MKNLFLLVAISTFSTTSLFAQEIRFGTKGGLNLASVNVDGESGGRTSFHIGSVVEFGITDEISIVSEVLFSGQGFKAEIPVQDNAGNTQNIEGTFKFNYINLPIMGKYEIVEGLSSYLGPQVGFLLSADFEANDQEVDVKDSFKSIDFSGAFGLGYELDNGLNFSARYTVGLSDIFEDGNADGKNNVLLVSVGYMFN
ncbi:MAG: porin family protein [Bacteroidota bacterium]